MKRILLIMICTMFTFSMMYAQESKKKNGKETVTFLIENMHCSNCIKKIEKNIAFEKGVTDLKCDLSTHTAEVTYRTDKTTQDNLVAAFGKIGMSAITLDESEKPEMQDDAAL